MRNRSRILSLILVSSLVTAVAWSQEDAFMKGMKKGMNLHDIANNRDTEMEAVEQFKAVAKEFPNSWEAPYWASFVQTQAAMATQDGETVLEMIEDCQRLLERSERLKSEKSSRDLVDFHTLRSLIHGFASSAYFRQGNREKGLEHVNLGNKALNDAAKAQPDHPRVLVLIGTDLISNGKRTKNARMVVAGRAALERAKQLFADFKPETPVSPDWARGWIDFWLQNRAELPD